MSKAILLSMLYVAAGLLAGCGNDDSTDAIARVGSSTLTADEFYDSIPEQLLAVMSLDDQEEALKAWIKTELFYLEGLRQGVAKDDDIQFRLHEIERELVAEGCIRQFLEDVPDVTEEEARAYFEAHKSDYSIQVRIAHILVRSGPEAERALEEIRAGTPFETVAAEVSIDQTAAQGGDLGYMRRGEMLHELEEAAFSLKVGEVGDVIPSSYGYHIIKVLDRHPGAGQPSFDSKRAAVMSFLTSQRRRGAFDEWLEELESRTTVVIDTVRLREEARARMQIDSEGFENAAAESMGSAMP
ncbi:MAG: peptidylprolyl isomerase [Candidatus Eisenbacteria bacterium]|nr:peptidylprolyl isomerase [Candidatus Eisenbacteria bacterium]